MLRKTRRFFHKAKGFSLVEMSAVLASVAAVVIVTASGVSIINKSRLGDISSDVNNFTKAVDKFEVKYGGIPGDLADVSGLPGSTAVAGNGNGSIDTNAEALEFWKHLALAGYITGSYNGTSTYVPGSGVPEGSITASGYNIVQSASLSLPDDALVIEIAGFSASSSSNDLAILKPADAFAIDQQIDDGLPDQGIIRASGSGGGNNCVSSGYNLSADTLSCRLQFVVRGHTAAGDAANITGSCTELGLSRERDDNTDNCPTGYVGKIVETCRIGSDNVGAWEITARNCKPVTCGATSVYQDTRTLACINGMAGGSTGISQICTENGVWQTTASDCVIDTSSCSPDASTRTPQACDWGESGRALQTCSGGNWSTSSDNCTAITCSGSSIGVARDSATNCGTNYTGTLREVCTIGGTWLTTSVGSSCAPDYSGICTPGNTININCSTGKSGEHTLICIDADTDYWTTLTDTCQPTTCDGYENIGTVRVKEGATCPNGRNGTVMEYCNESGAWQEVLTNCTDLCDGSLDTEGFANWPSTSAGSTATASSCIAGYEYSTAPTRDCQSNGQWSFTINNPCTRTTCAASSTGNAEWLATDTGKKDIMGQCDWPDYEGYSIRDCDVNGNSSGSWGTEKSLCSSTSVSTTNLALWFDAADFTTIHQTSACNGFVDGSFAQIDVDTVGCWMDKSGNGLNATTASAADEPSYISEVINGKAVIRFSNDQILSTGNLSLGDFAIFTVVRQTSGTGDGYIYEFGNSTTDSGYFRLSDDNVGTIYKRGSSNTSSYNHANSSWIYDYSSATANSSDNAILVSHIFTDNNNTHKLYVDSVEETPTNINSGDPGSSNYTNNFNIGSRDDATHEYDGDIAEILVYDNSSVNQSSIESYLGDKWGISLPVAYITENLLLHYDASDSSSVFVNSNCTGGTPANGGTLGCWQDISGNGHHMIQSNGSRQPLYMTDSTSISSMGSVKIEPRHAHLVISTAELERENLTAAATYMPTNYPTEGGGGCRGHILAGISWNTQVLRTDTTSGTAYVRTRADNQNTGAFLSSSMYDTPFIISSRFEDEVIQVIYAHGISRSTRTYNNATVRFGYIGYVGYDDSQMCGHIGELMVYEDNKSDLDREAIEDYLSGKWGIALEH